MWKRIRTWWATEGAMVALQGMDDRMLADMGLEREGLRERVGGTQAGDASQTHDDTPHIYCEALRF